MKFKGKQFVIGILAVMIAAATVGLGACSLLPEKDREKPVIVIDMAVTVEAGTSLEINYSATDNVGVVGETVTVKFSDEDVTNSVYNAQTGLFTPTEAGEYTIIVEARDKAGNSETATHTVTVTAQEEADTQKPVISFNMANALEVGSSLEVNYTATDNVGVVSETVTVKLGNYDVTNSIYNAQTNLFTPKAAGEYKITVEARDEAGNKETATHTVTVTEQADTQKPVISFNTANTLEVGGSLKVNYTATDNVGVVSETVTVKLGNQDVTSSVYNAQTKTFTPTAAGEYKITVEARDEAGNSETATHTVTVTAKEETKYVLPNNPNYGFNVSVHDPSVFYDNATKKYYAFGSHFAVASSSDLIHWTPETWFEDHGKQLLYGTTDFRSILQKSNELMGGNQNTWAPDVEYINGKYYMYYSLTSGFGSNKSLIGRVSSDNVLGPYSNEEIIVWSEGKSGNPNCIDPELFHDKNGKLWMVYGSFFAGIYIKELDPVTGLPLQNGVHDYGKLLWKGGGTGAEGPFIFYNAETDYYYLMTSDGSLSSDYNMRVARSKNPDGPYTDITGKDMASAYGGGNKLAGNYKFTGDTGWAALGHNSVIKVDGQYLVVCHARYEEDGGVSGGHNVQVRQLYFNEEGWPVLAPNRYAGEQLGKVTAADIAGDYDIILHSTGNDARFVPSERYTFTGGGAVKKMDVTVGAWELSENFYITVTVDGVVYEGVVAPCWNLYRAEGTLCITATSSSGRSLWANVASAAQAPSAIYTKSGSVANNTQITAFDTSNGFAVSFRLAEAIPQNNSSGNGFNDWNAVVVNCGDKVITLPNLIWNGEGNLYPNEAINQNGNGWNAYLETTCFVTVSVSQTNGIQFYKNGVLTQSYPSDTAIGSKIVADFVAGLLSAVQTDGFAFASNELVKAQDLTVTRAVTVSEAAVIYQEYSA